MTEADLPLEYRLEHLTASLAVETQVSETDVLLEVKEGRLVVRANLPTDERRRSLLEAIAERWSGPIDDDITLLTDIRDRTEP